MKANVHLRAWLLMVVVLLISAACVAPQTATAPSEGSTAPSSGGEKPVIKLVANPWSASAINVNVAKIIIEEKLGYQVEITDLDENLQWSALATGDQHASLEVWPSGHASNVAEYIDNLKQVENLGDLGVIGKIGWFIPTYLLTDHPELATWEGFQDPANVALFATAETGDAGQFLGGDTSWVQYDEQIIANLGLNLKVVWAGSEEAILAAVDAAYSRNDPVLIYFYSPHSAFARYDLTNVKLPENTPECWTEENKAAGKINCDYPSDTLFKIAWSGLKDTAPDVYNFLKKMNYPTETQIQLVAAVDSDGKTPADAANEWVDANEAVWSEWLK